MKPIKIVSIILSLLFLGMIITGAIFIGQNPPQVADSDTYNEAIAKNRMIGIILVVIGCVMFTGMPMLYNSRNTSFMYISENTAVKGPRSGSRTETFKHMSKWPRH